MGKFTLLEDDNNRIVKEFTNKKLNQATTEHLSDGHGQTIDIPLSSLPNFIRNMTQHQCLCNGIVEPAGSAKYEIKSKFNAEPGDIQRTKEFFSWTPGPAFLYFDFDKFEGSMEDGVEILCGIDKNLLETGLVGIYSSSGKLFDTETGKELSKKNSFHIWIEVEDGTLTQPYCDLIFNHLILNGHGSIKVVKKSGAKRIKSIIDQAVWNNPNREIFEANPVCCDGIESRRLDLIEVEDGKILNISKSISELQLSEEDKIKLALTKSKLKNAPEIVKESKEQKAIGRELRTASRAKYSDRKLKIESKRTVTDEEWEDKNGVLHTFLGANDWIKDSSGIEIQIKDILLNPEDWKDKPMPDPLAPYKRGDENRGLVGQGVAYVRYNDNESMHIFSFYGDVEYHLVWDMYSIIEEIEKLADDGRGDQEELDGFIEYVFDATAVNHKLSITEISTIGKKVADLNKEFKSNSSRFGIDARGVPAELKRITANRDILVEAEKYEEMDEDHIIRLNSKYGVCLTGGKARMVEEVYNKELHEWHPEFVALQEQKIFQKNNRVLKSAGGKVKSVGIVDDWEVNPNRNTYDRVIFEPHAKLFRGCGCKPVIKQGGEYNQWMGYLANLDNSVSCEKILWHIENIWCSGDKEYYEYTLAWLAELFQHPEKVGNPYLVIKSKQGSGKNIVIDKVICRLLGAHSISTSNKEDLIGRFNSHLGINVLLFLDEAIFAGDPRSKNLMKSLVNEFRVVEQKNIDKKKGKNYTKIIMATNEQHAANIEFTDRRHVYLPMSDEKKGDTKYFEELAMEIENGGREAFLGFMLEHETEIKLSVIPKGHNEQRESDMRRSESPAVRFIYALVEFGPEQFDSSERNYSGMEFKDWDTKSVLISKPDLFDMFKIYCRKAEISVPHTDVGIFLRDLSYKGIFAGDRKVRQRKGDFERPKGEICHSFKRNKMVRFYSTIELEN